MRSLQPSISSRRYHALLTRGLSNSCSGVFGPSTPGTVARRSHGRHHASLSALSTGGLAGLDGLLRISDEVRDALATNRPVVALESTIYTHGALGNDLDLEAIVRRRGAVPAVCGILSGTPTVGLTQAEVELMVCEGAKKVSRRDLAYLTGLGLAGQKLHGGTTISGTMILARLAGIRVFGTGGLGGVHRGGQDSMDISADLTELGRTRVAVVSSGCKGFLDIPRTLEFLETHGVAVSSFADGRAGPVDFPAFWARDSGVRSPSVVQDEKQAAAIILAQERLGVESGLLFANPIPEQHAIPRHEMEDVIDTAVREADEKGFSGNENTPYILKRIRELTQGRSVPANKHLVQANVARAADIAVELSKLLPPSASRATPAQGGRDSKTTRAGLSHRVGSSSPEAASPGWKDLTQEAKKGPQPGEQEHVSDILVAGSVALDLTCDYLGHGSSSPPPESTSPVLQTSNPAAIAQSVGGVGHNVALAAHLIGRGLKVDLCSLVGQDIAGATVLSAIRESGLDTSYIRQLGHEYHSARTAQYVAVNGSDRNLVLGMADMGIFASHSFPAYWSSAVSAARPRWLVVDANWSPADIRTWARAGRAAGARVAFEPVSAAKSARLFAGGAPGVFPHHAVDLAAPNQLELAAMHAAARDRDCFDAPGWFAAVDALGLRAGARDRFVRIAGGAATDAGVPAQSLQLLPFVPAIAAKLGDRGVLLTELLRPADPRLRDPAAAPYVLARADGHPSVGGVYMRAYPAAETVADLTSVTGAGDTFLGALVAGLAMGGRAEELVDVAQRAAVMTLRSREAVNPELGALGAELERAARGREC